MAVQTLESTAKAKTRAQSHGPFTIHLQHRLVDTHIYGEKKPTCAYTHLFYLFIFWALTTSTILHDCTSMHRHEILCVHVYMCIRITMGSGGL